MKQYDTLIIGSGPAGNTAAIYSIRNGFKTIMFTGINAGGQLTITTDIENFPAFPEPVNGLELMNRMLEQSKNLGIEIIYDSINSIDFSKRPFVFLDSNSEEYTAKNVIIATGATTKWLGLESEKKFLGFGVSGCATCDGNFFRNQPVAIIGGGDTAATEALHMSNIASKVYLIYRKSNLIRMQEILAKRLMENKKIDIILDSEVKEILGNENPKLVKSINIFNNKTNDEKILEVSAVFIAIGRKPESDLFKNTGIDLDENGYIITRNDSARTNIKNVYAVGDVTNKKFKQAVVAAGYGAIAALEIEEDNQ